VRLSLRIAFWAVVGSLPFGLATAIVLARGRFYGKSLLDGVVHLPLVMPPVVTGYLLLLLFGPHGPLGRFLDIEHRLADFALDIHFRAGRGPTALFGRSGAGKTSVINAIAGLLRPRRGRIAMDGSVPLDTERAICVPTHRRRVGCVFQEGRLFPHLTVRQNLLFGRWFAPARERRVTNLDDVVDLLGIAARLDRRPGRLSGGEKQRVAIGRALLASPRLLLRDEPLASLDDRRKDEILPYLERLRDEARVPIVYVSHSIAEVTRLATTIVLIWAGRVHAVGPVQDVMRRAELYPLAGRFEAGAVLGGASRRTTRAGFCPSLPAISAASRCPVWMRPSAPRCGCGSARDVILAVIRPTGISALNVLAAEVERLVPIEEGTLEVQLRLGGERLLARVARRSGEALGLAAGREVFAVIKTVAIDRRSLPRQGDIAELDNEIETFDS
jgi:molybdate transport system ATP-binding protein